MLLMRLMRLIMRLLPSADLLRLFVKLPHRRVVKIGSLDLRVVENRTLLGDLLGMWVLAFLQRVLLRDDALTLRRNPGLAQTK